MVRQNRGGYGRIEEAKGRYRSMDEQRVGYMRKRRVEEEDIG
jgi:hypothetical protein